MMEDDLFSEWLNKIIHEKQLTQAKLAQKSGLSKTAIHNLLSSKTKHPSLSSCKALADALEVPLETVLKAAGMPTHKTKFRCQDELNYVAAQLSETDQEMLLAFARIVLAFRRNRFGKY